MLPNRLHSPAEIVIDFGVSATLASRYRARLVAASRTEVEVRFPFAPSLFQSGKLESASAEVSITREGRTLRLPGLFRLLPMSGGMGGAIAFSDPVPVEDYRFLRRASGLDPEVVDPVSFQKVG
jgi:hypothetical protein